MSKTKKDTHKPDQDPNKILKIMFEFYLETKEAHEKHLFYRDWLRRYFIEN